MRGVVNHFVQNGDVIGGLEELQVLVVAGRHDRRSGVEAQEAALGQSAILRTVGADASHAEADGARRRDILRVGRSALLRHARLQRRHASVGRIDDERRAAVVDHARAPVEPEIVVGADVAAGRQRLGANLAGCIGLGGALHGRRLDLRRLLRGERGLVREVRRALERRQGPEVPHALQIRLAVRRARQHVVPGLLRGDEGRRHERDERERQQPPRRDVSIPHLKPPDSTRPQARFDTRRRRGDHALGRRDRLSPPPDGSAWCPTNPTPTMPRASVRPEHQSGGTASGRPRNVSAAPAAVKSTCRSPTRPRTR